MIIERRLKPRINVDLTPLIDVVFQLVIFFMISSTFKTTPGIELQLPESGSAETMAVAELTISIISENEIYVNKTLSSIQGMKTILEAELAGTAPDQIQATLEADSEVPYQLVISVLDSMRASGVKEIGLATRRKGQAP